MMKEWECDGALIKYSEDPDDCFFGNDWRDAEKTVRLVNRIIARANWLELVAMAQMRGVLLSHDRLDNQGPVRGYILTGLVDQKCIEIAKWSGTIADGHSHAAELAKALGLTEGGG